MANGPNMYEVLQVEQHALEPSAAYEEIQILNDQLKQENIRMSAELDVARRLQLMVLPPVSELKEMPGLDIVGYMQPADEVGAIITTYWRAVMDACVSASAMSPVTVWKAAC